MRSTASAIAASALLVLAPATAGADEHFLCADGKTIHVHSANRERMYEQPCVKAWFVEARAAKAAAPASRSAPAAAVTQPAMPSPIEPAAVDARPVTAGAGTQANDATPKHAAAGAKDGGKAQAGDSQVRQVRAGVRR